jgi:GNAT superfamily N-acetyltransferase
MAVAQKISIVATRLWKFPAACREILRHWRCQELETFISNPQMFVLHVDDEPASFCAVEEWKGHFRLKNVFTWPHHRSRGCASRLLTTVLQRLRGPVFITCREDMVPFYQRFGFVKAETAPLGVQIRTFFLQCASFLLGKKSVCMVRFG